MKTKEHTAKKHKHGWYLRWYYIDREYEWWIIQIYCKI